MLRISARVVIVNIALSVPTIWSQARLLSIVILIKASISVAATASSVLVIVSAIIVIVALVA